MSKSARLALVENFRMALATLKANKLRSSLPILEVRNVSIGAGRSLSREDVRHSRNVAVLAEGPVQVLFPNQDPIGRSIRIGTERYTIIGVFKKFPNPFSREPDQYVLIPYTAHR